MLEQLAEEESLLQKHGVFIPIQNSIAKVINDLALPRKSKMSYDVAKGELGHAYLLITSVEHIEDRQLIHSRRLIEFYGKQVGYKIK